MPARQHPQLISLPSAEKIYSSRRFSLVMAIRWLIFFLFLSVETSRYALARRSGHKEGLTYMRIIWRMEEIKVDSKLSCKGQKFNDRWPVVLNTDGARFPSSTSLHSQIATAVTITTIPLQFCMEGTIISNLADKPSTLHLFRTFLGPQMGEYFRWVWATSEGIFFSLTSLAFRVFKVVANWICFEGNVGKQKPYSPSCCLLGRKGFSWMTTGRALSSAGDMPSSPPAIRR